MPREYHNLFPKGNRRHVGIAPKLYAYLKSLGGSDGSNGSDWLGWPAESSVYGSKVRSKPGSRRNVARKPRRKPRIVSVPVPGTMAPEAFRVYIINYLRRRGMEIRAELRSPQDMAMLVWLRADDVDYVADFDREQAVAAASVLAPLWPPVTESERLSRPRLVPLWPPVRELVSIKISVMDIGDGKTPTPALVPAPTLTYSARTLTRAVQAALEKLPQGKEIRMGVPAEYEGEVERFRRNLFMSIRRKSIRLDTRVISDDEIAIWLTRLEYLYRQERGRIGV